MASTLSKVDLNGMCRLRRHQRLSSNAQTLRKARQTIDTTKETNKCHVRWGRE